MEEPIQPRHEILIRSLLSGLQASLKELPFNPVAWTQTFTGADGSDYLTRSHLPRILGARPLIHRIHRGDNDPFPHSHPWSWAYFLMVSGSYVDERWHLDSDGIWRSTERLIEPGMINVIGPNLFHRVNYVEPGTMTVGLTGPKKHEWGFMDIETSTFIDWKSYLRQQGRGFHLARE